MNNKILFFLALFLIKLHLVKGQSAVYLSFNGDMGMTNGVSFSENNLAKKYSSVYSTGLALSYRLKNIVSLEVGASQYSYSLRFKDKTFENAFDKFAVNYKTNNQYWNYHGAIRLNLPLDSKASSSFYTQFSYCFNNFKAQSISKTGSFVLTEKGVNQTVTTNVNYLNKNTSFLPEIGFETKIKDKNLFSIGIKANLGQSDVLNADYEVLDNNTGDVLYSDAYNSKGNFISLGVKYSILLSETAKKDKKGKKSKAVYVCHFGKTMEIKPEALAQHLKHGDTEGKCDEPKEEEKAKPEKVKKTKEPKVKTPKPVKPPKVKEPKVEKTKPVKKEPEKEEIKTDKNGVPKELKNRKIEMSNTVYVESSMITFKVWDSGKEVDGDTISLNLNGAWIVKNFGLTREKHQIRTNIDKNNKNFLMLYALNLGKYPPNTAAVSIWDGKTEQVLELKSDMLKCGALNIVYKPK